jgi:folate-dependent phosphoribosylglycinamide formyltransferase PurN
VLIVREKLQAIAAFFLIPKRTRIHFSTNINLDTNAKKILSTAQSTFIVIRGGRVLSSATLGNFKGVWVNIHGGVLPFYRGLDSHIWAAARNEFHRVGATMHLMTEKIDQGSILILEFLAVSPSDSLGKVEKKLSRLGSYLHHKAHQMNLISTELIITSSHEAGNYFSAFPHRLPKWTRLENVKNY